MDGVRLSVDYGTSNTVAVLEVPGGQRQVLLFDGFPLLPSAVHVSGDGELLVGGDAVRSARLDPHRYEPNPKRRIDDGEVLLGERGWPVTALITATLRRVAEEASRVAGRPADRIDQLVLTCPVAWAAARRALLLAAAERAGLPEPVLVAEPLAAASYYATLPGRQLEPGQSLVVYDLGAGTFDVCAVRRTATGFESLAHRGLDDFGGIDLDELIVKRVAAHLEVSEPDAWARLAEPRSVTDRRAAQDLRDDARSAKEVLSRHSSARLPIPLTDRDLAVGREEFEQLAGVPLQRTVDLTADTIQAAGLTPAKLAGVFLVGGASRVPLVATLLHRALGVAPTILEQPETAVAHGALIATPPAVDASGPEPVEPVEPVISSSGPPRARRAHRRVRLAAVLAAVLLLAVSGTVWMVLTDRSAAGGGPRRGTAAGSGTPTAAASPTTQRYSKPPGDLCSYLDWDAFLEQTSVREEQVTTATLVSGTESAGAVACHEYAPIYYHGTSSLRIEVDAVFFGTDAECRRNVASDRARLTSEYISNQVIHTGLPPDTYVVAYSGSPDSVQVWYGTSRSNVEVLATATTYGDPRTPDELATAVDTVARSLFDTL